MNEDMRRLIEQVEDLAEGRITRNARIKALEDALREIAVLARTDGPAAPLLVRAGDIAEAALAPRDSQQTETES